MHRLGWNAFTVLDSSLYLRKRDTTQLPVTFHSLETAWRNHPSTLDRLFSCLSPYFIVYEWCYHYNVFLFLFERITHFSYRFPIYLMDALFQMKKFIMLAVVFDLLVKRKILKTVMRRGVSRAVQQRRRLVICKFFKRSAAATVKVDHFFSCGGGSKFNN